MDRQHTCTCRLCPTHTYYTVSITHTIVEVTTNYMFAYDNEGNTWVYNHWFNKPYKAKASATQFQERGVILPNLRHGWKNLGPIEDLYVAAKLLALKHHYASQLFLARLRRNT